MKRIARVLGRVKASVIEFKETNAPMPNPPDYEPSPVSLENLRKLPLSAHRKILSEVFREYRTSFDDSFAWSKDRTKAHKEEGDEDESKMAAVIQDKRTQLDGLVKSVREATHKTPEDLEAAKKEMSELMDELHESRHDLKAAAQEKLDIIRVSLAEFSVGYREARDTEVQRVMAMDESLIQDFLKERAAEVQHASKVIANTIIDEKNKTDEQREREAKQQEEEDSASDKEQGLKRFMSPRAREAIDEVLDDPDVSELRGRVKGFARERLLQAEEAARILKEDQEPVAGSGTIPCGSAETLQDKSVENNSTEQTEVSAVNDGNGTTVSQTGEGAGEGGKEDGGTIHETPILSGLVTNAKEFLEGRVREVKAGAGEVWDMAKEARESSKRASGGDSSNSRDDGGDGTKMLESGTSEGGGEEVQRPRPTGEEDAGSGHEETKKERVVGKEEKMSRPN